MEEGEGEGLVEDDEGVARLPERVEKGYLPGCDGERVRGHAGRGRRNHRLRLARQSQDSENQRRRDLHASRTAITPQARARAPPLAQSVYLAEEPAVGASHNKRMQTSTFSIIHRLVPARSTSIAADHG